MKKEDVIKRSNEIWSWAKKNYRKRKVYSGFKEILRFEDYLKRYRYSYTSTIDDGGLTIVVQHKNGKKLAKVRENCFSYGAAADLLEVCGLYGQKSTLYGFVSAEDAYLMLLNSFKSYEARLNGA